MNSTILNLGMHDPTIFWPDLSHHKELAEMPSCHLPEYPHFSSSNLIGNHSRQIFPNQLRIIGVDDIIEEIRGDLCFVGREYFESTDFKVAKIYTLQIEELNALTNFFDDLSKKIDEQENLIKRIIDPVIPQEEINDRLEILSGCRKRTYQTWQQTYNLYNIRDIELKEEARKQELFQKQKLFQYNIRRTTPIEPIKKQKATNYKIWHSMEPKSLILQNR